MADEKTGKKVEDRAEAAPESENIMGVQSLDDMDQELVEHVLDTQARDLMRIISDAKARGEKVNFYSLVRSDDKVQVAYLFKPKAEVDDLPEEAGDLSHLAGKFNILGLARVGKRTRLALLGVSSRPFTTLRGAGELKKTFRREAVVRFTSHVLRLGGMDLDLWEMDMAGFSERMKRFQVRQSVQAGLGQDAKS